MKKLKQLLKESYVWERKFGESLPTLEDTTRKHQENLKEADLSKVKIPAQVNRWLDRFIESMKDEKLTRLKRSAILFKVIDAAGMTPKTLMQDIQKIKRGLDKK